MHTGFVGLRWKRGLFFLSLILGACASPRQEPVARPDGAGAADRPREAAPAPPWPGAEDGPMTTIGSGGNSGAGTGGTGGSGGGSDAPVDQPATGPGPSDPGCASGLRACPGGGCVSASDGCCSDQDCAVANGTAVCTGGRCGPVSCASGWGDCQRGAPDCETRLDTGANCGTCGESCGAVGLCESGRCRCPGQICGGACVATDKDPDHCGACDRRCPGACAASKCQCTASTSANLVQNPNFDAQLSGWNQPQATVNVTMASSSDAYACPGSGSAITKATSTSPFSGNWVQQCITRGIKPSTAYNFGAWFKFDSATPRLQGFVSVNWFSTATCPETFGQGLYVDANLDSDQTPPGVWTEAWGSTVAPADTRSVLVRSGFSAYGENNTIVGVTTDMVYLTPAPGRWTETR